MKRILFLLMVLALIVAVAPAAFAVSPENCAHQNTEHFDAKPATCDEPGYEAHRYCADCDSYLLDADKGETPYTKAQVYEEAKGHVGTAYETKPATHTENGHWAHFACDVCGGKFESAAADAAELSEEEVVILATGHIRAEKVEGKPATCTENGALTYYYCAECDAKFESRDPAAAELTDDEIVILSIGHQRPEQFLAKPATCTEAGNYEYYLCGACGGYLLKDDEAQAWVEVTREDVVIIAHGHDTKAELIEYKAATCTEPGNHEYKLCGKCGAYLMADEENQVWVEVVRDEVVIMPLGHERPELIPAKPATCNEVGNYEYYLCNVCGKYLEKDNENQTWVELTREEVLILPMGHERPEKIEALKPTHTTAGHNEYWHCSVCGKNYDGKDINANELTDEDIYVAPLGHDRAELVEGKPATHTEAGRADYYYCAVCDAMFDGRDGFATELTEADLVIAPMGHIRAEKVEGYPATCTENGAWEYYYCAECDKKFEHRGPDAAELSDEEIVILAMGHVRPLKFDELRPTCTEAGHIEFYVCEACGTYLLADEENQTWIETTREEVVILPLGHERPLKFEATPATCTEAGCIEFYVCEACGTYLLKDEENQTWIETTREEVVILPLGHERPLKFEAERATCTEAGHIEFYVCEACGTYLLKDEENQKWIETTREEVVILPIGHQRPEKFEAKPATCTEAGNYEYYLCGVCGAYLVKDEEAQTWVEVTREDIVILAIGHERIEKVDAVKPTTEKEGMKEHYYCSKCDKYFSDRAGENEVTRESLIIPKLEDGTEPPKVGDETIMAMFALIVMSVMGIACVTVLKKRSF